MIVLYVDMTVQDDELREWIQDRMYSILGYSSSMPPITAIDQPSIVMVYRNVAKIAFYRDADAVYFKMKFSDAINAATRQMQDLAQIVEQYERADRNNKRELPIRYYYDQFPTSYNPTNNSYR